MSYHTVEILDKVVIPKPTEGEHTFQLTGVMPPVGCANCEEKKDISIVPYHETRGGPMVAVLLLCKLCLSALFNKELGAFLEIRVTGQDPWE